MTIKKTFSYIFSFLLYGFACIGVVFTSVFIAMNAGFLNVKGSISSRNSFFSERKELTTSVVQKESPSPCKEKESKECAWNTTPEWEVIKGGLIKDKDIILRVSRETGVSSRMIASVVVPEQTRFFTSNRDVFKRYFEPLKILGSLSQFSLGVSGIKQETAKKIEEQANDPSSDFYPGETIPSLLTYKDGEGSDKELFNRLTNEKNHYYSYLYTAIFIKEITSQWAKSGYDVQKKPEVVVTLFNIGFSKSKPNGTPKAGGAIITTGGHSYPYGELGALFYYSDELRTEFPE